MEDLEEQCIERLNKLLYNYGLKIIYYSSVLSNLIYDYYLYDEINCYHVYKWTSFNDILFNYNSLFYKLHQYYETYLSQRMFVLLYLKENKK